MLPLPRWKQRNRCSPCMLPPAQAGVCLSGCRVWTSGKRTAMVQKTSVHVSTERIKPAIQVRCETNQMCAWQMKRGPNLGVLLLRGPHGDGLRAGTHHPVVFITLAEDYIVWSTVVTSLAWVLMMTSTSMRSNWPNDLRSKSGGDSARDVR